MIKFKYTITLFSVLIAVILVFALGLTLPNATQGVADAVGHTHHYCGKAECSHSVCNKASVEYTELTKTMIESLSTTTNNEYIIPAGKYVLAEDIDISSAINNALIINSGVEVSLCLNGFTLKCASVTNKGNLFLCDCSQNADGSIIVTTYNGVNNENQFVMYSGVVESIATTLDGYSNYTGAIKANSVSSKIIIYGGEVKATGGNAKIYAIKSDNTSSQLSIYGGVISSSATAVKGGGTTIIEGGRIEGAEGKYSYSSTSGTTTISGGTFVGRIFTGTVDVYKHYLTIVGSKTIQNDGIHLGKIPGSGVYYIDVKEYTGPSTFAISLSESTIEDLVYLANANAGGTVEKVIAKGTTSKLVMDSTRNPDWKLINATEGVNNVVKLNHIGHTGGDGTATCNEGKICEVCKLKYGDVDPSVHTSDSVGYQRNNDGTHDKVHMCCSATIEENITCSLDPDISYSCTSDKKCKDCSYVLEPAGSHRYDGYTVMADCHYQECKDCLMTTDYQVHVYDDDNDMKCNVCDADRVTGYNIFVGEVEVTSANMNDVLGDIDIGATVTYNPITNVLTLNNATIQPHCAVGIDAYDYLNESAIDINIHLIGTNSIIIIGWEEGTGIVSSAGVNISADAGATLNIIAEDENTRQTCGISAETIYIESGSVRVSGDYAAVMSADIIAQAQGSITAKADTLSSATVGEYQGAITVLVGTELAKTVLLTPTYNLSVGGVAVNSSNASDIFDDAESHNGLPTAKYDVLSNTLTLTNANITTFGEFGAIESMLTSAPTNLNIHLVGENFIAIGGDTGIISKNLTITADEGASLTINAIQYGIYLYRGIFAIKSGELLLNAQIAMFLEESGIAIDKYVVVGSKTLEATDLELATIAYIDGINTIVIGDALVENVVKTARIYPHVHEWTSTWAKDDSAHWHECSALGCYISDDTQKYGYAQHAPEHDDGDCTTAENCVCGVETVPISSHSFDNDCDATCNKCSFTREVLHDPNEDDGDCTTPVMCSVCGVVTATAKAQHAFDNACDTSCNNAGCDHSRQISHVPNQDDGDCTTDVLCSICGDIAIEGNLSHTWSDTYLPINSDENKHYYVCTVDGCEGKDSGESHTPNIDAATTEYSKYCTICNYVLEAQLGHTHHYVEVADENYQVSAGNCLTKAVYHKSCECGHVSSETFEGDYNLSVHVMDTFIYVDNNNNTHTKKNECCGTVVHASETHSYDVDDSCVCGAERSIVATYTITIENGTSNGETSVVVNENGTVTVVANVPPQGQEFKGWAVNGEIVSTDEIYTFNVSQNMTITAVFEDMSATIESDLSDGTIAGIVIASVAVLSAIGFVVFWFIKKKK